MAITIIFERRNINPFIISFEVNSNNKTEKTYFTNFNSYQLYFAFDTDVNHEKQEQINNVKNWQKKMELK